MNKRLWYEKALEIRKFSFFADVTRFMIYRTLKRVKGNHKILLLNFYELSQSGEAEAEVASSE